VKYSLSFLRSKINYFYAQLILLLSSIMLDYKLLQALAVVIQEGGFDKAAQYLNLTQSAVSQRIKLLEEQTGQIVIARTTPPSATAAGQQMIKHYLQVKRLEGDLFDTLVPSDKKDFVTLAIGTNRDCLATWLFQAISPFLEKRRVVLEFRAADQEQTHRLMKEGDAIGCISVKDQPMQGCRVEYLGCMDYRLVATQDFAENFFPEGIHSETITQAPLILFDRKDEMHLQFFRLFMKDIPSQLPIHYVPSTRTYADFIYSGLAYGLLPDQECESRLESGRLINLCPGITLHVQLYWHCWNLKSKLLEDLTNQLLDHAKNLLHQ
jgi:LysR family transcriptional regulator, chromosome initiation inhibitor